MITKYDAVLALVPDVSFGVTSEGQIIWHEEPQQKPTEKAIQAKLAELQADYDSKKYQRDRASQYPSIADQLDMQYHDAIDGTTTWKDSIAKVKADNPKPE